MDSINLTHIIISGLTTTVLTLVSAVVILWKYTKQMHKIQNEEHRERNEKMTSVLIDTATAITSSTNAMIGVSKSVDGNSKIIGDVQNLVHSVNLNLAEVKMELKMKKNK